MTRLDVIASAAKLLALNAILWAVWMSLPSDPQQFFRAIPLFFGTWVAVCTLGPRIISPRVKSSEMPLTQRRGLS
jgi:hypothetical protein